MVPLIVALDVDILTALEVAPKLQNVVAGFKVGWDLIFEGGISIVSELSKYGNIIVDIKIADIPYVSNKIIDKLIRRGACCVIVHGFLHPSLPRGPHIYALIKMTMPTTYDEIWEKLLERIEGVRGFVLPGNQPEVIAYARKKLGCQYRIISPGIGAQGGKPGQAIAAGADFEISGRYVIDDLSKACQWENVKPTCFETP